MGIVTFLKCVVKVTCRRYKLYVNSCLKTSIKNKMTKKSVLKRISKSGHISTFETDEFLTLEFKRDNWSFYYKLS